MTGVKKSDLRRDVSRRPPWWLTTSQSLMDVDHTCGASCALAKMRGNNKLDSATCFDNRGDVCPLVLSRKNTGGTCYHDGLSGFE
jgi:hypothetical protein